MLLVLVLCAVFEVHAASITGLVPERGEVGLSTGATLTGSGFADVTEAKCYFGVSETDATFISDVEVRCTTPALPASPGSVAVRTSAVQNSYHVDATNPLLSSPVIPDLYDSGYWRRVANPNFAQFPHSQDLTIDMWLKPVSVSVPSVITAFTGSQYRASWFVAFDSFASGGYKLKVGHNYATIAGGTVIRVWSAVMNTNVKLNVWTHLAIVRDATVKKYVVYINGVYVDEATYTTSPNFAGYAINYLYLGRAPISGFTIASRLQFDEYRLWKTIRTPAQIAANMYIRLDTSSTTPPVGLSSYFPFNENAAIPVDEGVFQTEHSFLDPFLYDRMKTVYTPWGGSEALPYPANILMSSSLSVAWGGNGVAYDDEVSSSVIFAVYPAVEGDSVIPNLAPSFGGVDLTVRGSNFMSAAACYFQGARLASTLQSPRELRCSSPAAPVGTFGVVSVSINGIRMASAGELTMVDPPVVTRALPSNAVFAGGGSVTLSGSGFYDSPLLACVFELLPDAIMSPAVHNGDEVICTVPAVPASGTWVEYTVKASNDGVTFGSGTSFIFSSSPSILDVSPLVIFPINPPAVVLTIVGTNFIDSLTLSVTIGGVPVVATFRDTSQLLCSSPPALSSGSAFVQVSNDGFSWSVRTILAVAAIDIDSLLVPDTGVIGASTTVVATGGPFDATTLARAGGTVLGTTFSSPSISFDIMPATGHTLTVTVSNNGQQYSTTSAHFHPTGAITVSRYEPTSGPEATTSSVYVDGENFRATTVGMDPAQGLVCIFDAIVVPAVFVSTRRVQCVAPTLARGEWTLKVSNNGGQQDTVVGTYQSTEGPTVEKVRPSNGQSAASFILTVTGTSFASAVDHCAVISGTGTAAMEATWVSAEECLCAVGPGPAGAVVVEINVNGFDQVSASGVSFERLPPLTGLTVSPRVEPAGTILGTVLTIRGPFIAVSAEELMCRFTLNTTIIVVPASLSGADVSCSTPKDALGAATAEALPLTVEVTQNGGIEWSPSEDPFLYVVAPQITSVAPNNARQLMFSPLSVTITGTGFRESPDLACRFYVDTFSEMFDAAFVSDTEVRCPAPNTTALADFSQLRVSVTLNGQHYTEPAPFFSVEPPELAEQSWVVHGGTIVDVVLSSPLLRTEVAPFAACSFGSLGIVPGIVVDAPASKAIRCVFPSSADLPHLTSVPVLASYNGVHFSASRSALFSAEVAVTSISPSSGYGLTVVSVLGAQFIDSAFLRCHVDAETVEASATFISATEVKCEVPFNPLGPAAISVSNDAQHFTEHSTPFLYTNCPLGSGSAAYALPCTPCAAGEYRDQANTSSCWPCPPGSVSAEPGATACEPCEAGYYALERRTECLPCSPGQIAPRPSMGFCEKCPPGSHVNASHATECVPCAAGAAAYAPGSPVCTRCLPGYFGPTPGLLECFQCNTISYQPMEGAEACLACPQHAETTLAIAALRGVSGALKIEDCTCKNTYYSLEGKGTMCRPCPVGAVCAGGEAGPVAVPGFWPAPLKEGAVEAVFLECIADDACVGGGQCGEGYGGRLCALCQPGYYKLARRCTRCPASGLSGMLQVLILFSAFAGAAALITAARRAQGKARFATVAIAFSTLQVLSLFLEFRMAWPGAARGVLSVLSFLNFNVEVSAPECSYGSMAYFSKWLLTLFIPFLMVVVFLIEYGAILLRNAMARRFGRSFEAKHPSFCAEPSGPSRREAVRSWCSRLITQVYDDAEMKTIRNSVLRAYWNFLVLGYLSVTLNIVKYMDCTKLDDGTWSMDSDPATKCFEGEWLKGLPFVIIFTLLYVLGIPVGMVAVLRYKRSGMQEDKFLARYGSFVARYKAEWYLFESVILLRKGLLVATLLVTSDPALQVCCGTSILAVFVAYEIRHYPYRMPLHNRLEWGSLATAAGMLLFGVLTLSESALVRTFSAVVITVLVFLILIMICLFVFADLFASHVPALHRLLSGGEVYADASTVDASGEDDPARYGADDNDGTGGASHHSSDDAPDGEKNVPEEGSDDVELTSVKLVEP